MITYSIIGTYIITGTLMQTNNKQVVLPETINDILN